MVVAANREERYARLADPPSWIGQSPRIFAGRDRSAGGTWLGVNEYGLLVALTNRYSPEMPAGSRSRGLLCLDALRQPTAARAATWLRRHLSARPYSPCNLICADALQAFAFHHDGTDTLSVELSPGVHLLAETDVDAPGHPRLKRARQLLADAEHLSWPELRPMLARIMADHGANPGSPAAICRHGDASGTVSSSLIALPPGGGLSGARIWFADGPPCHASYSRILPPCIGPVRTRPNT